MAKRKWSELWIWFISILNRYGSVDVSVICTGASNEIRGSLKKTFKFFIDAVSQADGDKNGEYYRNQCK